MGLKQSAEPRPLPIKVSDNKSFPLVQRLAAGLLECLLLQKAHTFAALWPEPGELLTCDTPVRGLFIEHVREAFQAAGPLARAAVLSAMEEAAALVPQCSPDELPRASWGGTDPRAYDYRRFGEALLLLLQGNTLRDDKVIDFGRHLLQRDLHTQMWDHILPNDSGDDFDGDAA